MLRLVECFFGKNTIAYNIHSDSYGFVGMNIFSFQSVDHIEVGGGG